MWRTDSSEKTLMLGKIEVRGEGDYRGWNGWMASLTLWTWAWVSSGSWWWTGKPGVLQSMGSQRVRHNWVTELNWTELSTLKWGFPGGSGSKEPVCNDWDWVWSLGQEDPLEKEMATHSSVLAWRIPWTEEPGRLQSMGSQNVRHNWATKTSLLLSLYSSMIHFYKEIR